MTPSGPAATSALHAHTVDTAAPRELHDLLDDLGHDGFVWWHDDELLVTSGIAARVAPGDVHATLAAIDGDRDDLVACGALPFVGAAQGSLVVPARIVRVRGDRCRVTTVQGADPAPRGPIGRVPRRFTVEARQDLAAWDAAVAAALALIDDGALHKVVLAREVIVEADARFSVADTVATLRRTQPGCFVFADGGTDRASFVGASPELLVRRNGTEVTSRPMAGTVARQQSLADDDAAIAALATSVKDNEEHRFVVEAVVDALGVHCRDVVASAPEPVRLTTVTHLTTSIRGTLTSGASALDLALALHPTPAVGGTPRAAAVATIAELEPFERGRYGGAVGWVDAAGNGEFAVALRCAELDGPRARLLAGAGIVAGSDPDLEWSETQAKLEPMLRTLVRP